MVKLRFKRLTKRKKRLILSIAVPLATLVIGIAGGIYLSEQSDDKRPVNLVWTVDQSVYLPEDLNDFLMSQESCTNQINPGQKGVRLWAIMQVYLGSYAKIAYGCSSELKSYIIAIKQNSEWQLLQPENYFSDKGEGALPLCKTVAKYQIPAEVEPFCINNKGRAEPNEL